MAEITLIEAVTQALAYEIAHDPSVVVLGEDVGVNGGVFRATAGLHARFGSERILDTPLDETTIAGLAVGMAFQGMKPVAEAQFDGIGEGRPQAGADDVADRVGEPLLEGERHQHLAVPHERAYAQGFGGHRNRESRQYDGERSHEQATGEQAHSGPRLYHTLSAARQDHGTKIRGSAMILVPGP